MAKKSVRKQAPPKPSERTRQAREAENNDKAYRIVKSQLEAALDRVRRGQVRHRMVLEAAGAG